MLRHRLDAIDAGAEVHAVQIELEDLLLGELRLDQQRDAALLDLAAEALDVRQEDRARELLRQRAAAFQAAAAADVAHDRARDADGIDAGVVIEAAILDGDHRVLQVGRDLVERYVVALLVEPEPRLAVRAVEHGVADAARQAMDRHGISRQPDAGDHAAGDQCEQERQRDPVGPAARPQQAQRAPPRFSFTIAYSNAVVKITTMIPSEMNFGISKPTQPSACAYSRSSLAPTHAMITNAPSTSTG